MEPNISQESSPNSEPMLKKDYWLGILLGFIIGLLTLPVLGMAKPDLYLKLRLIIVPFFLIVVPFGLALSHLISKKIKVIWQLAKFVVTGVMNVLVDFGILSLLIIFFKNNLSINSTDIFFSLIIAVTFYSFFKSISFIVANINSYFWNKYWTFDRVGDKHSEFFQFFIVSLVGFAINVIVASLVFSVFSNAGGLTSDQWALIGAAGGSVAGLAWNFIGYKFIVFKK